MNTNTATKPLPTTITIGGREFRVAADGWCAQLDAFIIRLANGRLATVPVD
jgi:hypothetical protein